MLLLCDPILGQFSETLVGGQFLFSVRRGWRARSQSFCIILHVGDSPPCTFQLSSSGLTPRDSIMTGD
jgi:hypothetical protein